MINTKPSVYQKIHFPKTRRFLTDVLALGQRKHLIHGLVEVDVTEARRRLRERRKETGTALSFTGFVIGCVAKAVDENKMLHAYRGYGERLTLFDDVDVATMIEVEANGRRFPLGHIIRAANKRPLSHIHAEIRRVQQAKRKNVACSLPGRGTLLMALPAFLRQILYRASLKRPRVMKKRAGTVLVTAVGMFGGGGGWGIPISMHTLAVTLGGVSEKPGVVAGEIEVREYLSLTLSMDHDIIDGAPAARFAQRLKELIEKGYGFEEESIE
jgi:pyruvate/2-oxoglutarate dehydrogenase complex dihydrolipoamide acyltransferase (E2) component